MRSAPSFGPYVARLDDAGRSAIDIAPLEFVPRPGNLEVAELWSTAGAVVRTSRIAATAPLDVGVRPGEVRSLVTSMPAGYDSGLHWTKTVDFSVVLDGQVEFVVETGEVTLDAGDCVLVCGVLHAWRAFRRSTVAVTMTGIAMDTNPTATWSQSL